MAGPVSPGPATHWHVMAQGRLLKLAGIAALWVAIVLYNLISLQVIHHQHYVQLAKSHQERPLEIAAPRGTLFDRTGQTLAMSVPTESVYVNPLKLPDLEVAADLLGRVLHLDRAELLSTLKQAYDDHRGYLLIKRRIEFQEAENLRALRCDWIGVQHESQRHYPKGSLGAHVLGGVDFKETGQSGIERALEEDLRGVPGKMSLVTDVTGRSLDSQLFSQPRPGTAITLTIDERIQFVAERELKAAVAEHHAATGSIVVMNPINGEVLAMASYPTYDPNLPPLDPKKDLTRINHAISIPFEPGSVFKVVTLSAALETTRLKPESPINCHGGVISLPGRVIHDSHGGIGVVPMSEVLARSSNVGAIEIGSHVGAENLYKYVRRFGFGQKTGIEIKEENRGRVWPFNRWRKTSWASVSMGQEVGVTTLQLAQAASVVANGGLLVHPHLVLKKGGNFVPVAPPVRILQPENAILMRSMMEGVVVLPFGTGRRARLDGYSVGGKTGSAQIFDTFAKHYTHSYNGTFMGFAPITNPALVVVVTLNGTHGEAGFGGTVAAPVFHTIATEALRVMEVPRDLPDEKPGLTMTAVESVADLADADASAVDNVLMEDDDDAPGAVVAALSGVPSGPTVPNFKGMNMRAVLAAAAEQGLTILPAGSGIARVQNPPPGSPLHQGERIRVQFAR
jgi:cell division protein FtsI (penicillin-binding protein 3)